MGKKILFSPIGLTDPITTHHDGSMLHIVRHYQPDKIYLFLSKEMCVLEEQDHRYTGSLELLRKFQGKNFEYELIKYEDLVDVQDYNVFYEIFGKIIKEISEKMDEEDTLLVNIASGTPAMKSALGVLAALSEYQFTTVQVSTPLKSGNKDVKEYDLLKEWKENKDNYDGTEVRCEAKKIPNLVQLLKMDMIRKHIKVYDYVAALQIAKGMNKQIPLETVTLLEIANARLLLDFTSMNNCLSKLSDDYRAVLIPISKKEERSIYEYALGLQIKLKKEEYADFIRAITPIVVDLFCVILNKRAKINISDYTSPDKSGVECWDKKKLNGTSVYTILRNKYNPFNDGPVYSHHLQVLINEYVKNALLIKEVKNIRHVERKVRNIAAHEIVSITPEKILKLTGFKPEQILQIIRKLMFYAGIDTKCQYWDSYDTMNKLILKSMKTI